MFNSAKMRLTVWYAGVLALVLALFAVLTYLLFAYTLQNQTDETLSEIAGVFETTANRELADEDKAFDSTKTDEAVRDAATELAFKDYQVFAFTVDNRLIAATKAADSDTQISPEGAANQLKILSSKTTGGFSDFENAGETFRVFFYTFRLQNQSYKLLVVHPLDDQKELLLKVRYAFLISVPLALFAASFGGFFLAKKSLAPITEMSRKAEDITAKNLHERLPVKNERDELGSLAGKFNELLSRLDVSFEQQRRFMADASHELRTPVAIVRGEADVVLGKENRDEAEYRESFSIVQSEAERMTRIIEDLFTLARVDAGQQPLRKETIYLDEILSESVKSFRTVAKNRNITLRFETPEEMKFYGDAQLLRRLFSNLIDNALKHAKTRVEITAERRADFYEIKVSDDGAGVPVEAQPHIFERFYRADKARTREDKGSAGSGAGLGLAISAWIAEAHHGRLTLLSSDENGTTFLFTVSQIDDFS
jgi:heavy metal sensor kinase